MKSCSVRISAALGALSWAAMACASATRIAVPTSPPRALAALTLIEQQIMAAAVDSVAAAWKDSTALCLRILGGPTGWELPPDTLLGMLRTRQRPVSATRCPRTYTSMVVHTDSLGRITDPPPPGYIDPYVLTVGRPQFESDSYGWVYVRELQGTAGREYLCNVQYVRARAWAHCTTLARWIH